MSTAENPALVLNADFRPLSYYPLSLCSWQDAIKAVFLERVSVIENLSASLWDNDSLIIFNILSSFCPCESIVTLSIKFLNSLIFPGQL